jgi:ATP-binding cassette, subfamily B, bacterial
MSQMHSVSPVKRLIGLFGNHKGDIANIYAYAVLGGLLQLAVPLGIQSIINFIMGATISTSIYVLIALVVVAVLLVGLFQINTMKIIEKIQQRIFVENAFAFSENIPRLDLKSTDQIYLPEYVNRFFDTLNIQKGLSKILIEVPAASIQILFGLALLTFYNGAFIGLGLLIIAILFLVLWYTSKRGLYTSLKESSYKYNVVAWLQEMARIIKSFKFSQGTHLNLRKADESVQGYLGARTDHFFVLLTQYRVLVFFKVVITASMLIVGTILLLEQKINLGAFIAAEIVILTVLGAIEKLISSLDSVYDVVTGLEKVASVIETPLEKQGHMKLDASEGIAIEFHDVSFGYNEDLKVLQNVSFNIKPGDKVSITGADASGKTTLLKLLSGSYHDYTGMILINHQNLHAYDLASIRTVTGTYLQHQDIFKGTVLENISFGRQDITPKQIIDIASELGIRDFISALSYGLDEEVDPTGKRLSSKIIEGILLLRAIVHKPKLLLLEEPWLTYSAATKQKMLDYFLNKIPETTVLLVSADPLFVDACDAYYQLADGNIKQLK